MSDTDMELLARYAGQHAEDAFAEIVRRHLGLVYSAALRQVRSPQLAEEVAQSAFIDLARSAARLKPGTVLAAWLYRVTCRTAIDVIRREAGRQSREQTATELNAMNDAADWTHIEPLLDEAMHALNEVDRTAMLLRYFENKSLREVGQTLGTSENAAQKRLSRAVETLRAHLARRGVTVGAGGLAVVLSTNSVQAVPAGLSATISSAALAGTSFVTTANAILMTTLQKILVGSVVAAAVAVVTYKVRQPSDLPPPPSSIAPVAEAAPMMMTASGLRYQVLRKGAGTVLAKPADKVLVHYHGTLPDGTVFDSSMDRGKPMVFPVDSVIAGWTEGIQLMKAGDLFKFEIPPHLGYGEERIKSTRIPPNSTLVFEVELLEIQ